MLSHFPTRLGVLLQVGFLVVVVGVVVGAPQKGSSAPEVTITRSEFEDKGDGTFSWASELSDGSKQEQSGFLKQIGEEQGISISGSYSYTSPEGEVSTHQPTNQ